MDPGSSTVSIVMTAILHGWGVLGGIGTRCWTLTARDLHHVQSDRMPNASNISEF